jgi:hypothetical protein
MSFEELMALITTKNGCPIAVPMLIFSEAEMRTHVGDLDRKLSLEDLALSYFQSLGFHGNRTRMNLYGYLGDFRDLVDSPPPWIEAQGPGTFYNHVTGKTQNGWNPFWESCFSYTFEELNEMRLTVKRAYKAIREEQDIEIPGDVQHSLDLFEEFNFKRLYDLAHAFGEEKLLQVAEFLADWFGDHYQALPGTPDLLIWRLKPKMWFFAEIKGPRDSLRNSQINWITEFKDKISDNVFILKVI